MALIRWRPRNLLSDFFDEDLNIDLPTLPAISRLTNQGLDLYETDGKFIAEVAIPGVPEDRIDVTVAGNTVRVTGSYEENQEERDRRRYFMSSIGTSFNYAFRLPENVIPDQEPQCELDNGVLRLSFDKKEVTLPKKIRIQRAKKGDQSKISQSSHKSMKGKK